MTLGLPTGQPLRLTDEETRPAVEQSGTEALIPSGQEGTGLSPEIRQRLDERIAAAGATRLPSRTRSRSSSRSWTASRCRKKKAPSAPNTRPPAPSWSPRSATSRS